ncbi:hypothetical protein [Peptoclostridium litorale]|uniref:hypothetical protein n=1 Tax=Peptoclostridium litorale TaxID=1557 RepID=UPI000571B4A0|nr:hypothetical protein [Peptoclostridium litorale]
MNSMFSNKVMLQVAVIALALLLAGSAMQNRSSKSYFYGRVDRDLEEAVEEMKEMNKALFGIYMEQDIEEKCRVYTDHIFSLARFDDEIETEFNMQKGAFDWDDIWDIRWTMDAIRQKGELSKEDEEYLESAHSYNRRLIESYGEILSENKTDEYDFKRDGATIKKVYREFISRANKMASEQEYRDMTRYRPYYEDGGMKGNGMDEEFNISEKQAEEMAADVLEKLFGEKPAIENVGSPGEPEYEFYNSWDDGRDEDMYSISIDKNSGSLSMYKRSQVFIEGLKDEDLDKKAREIMDIFVPEGYVLYGREKWESDDEIDRIEYSFISQRGDVYDESHAAGISINSSGALNELYISDPFGRIGMEMPEAGVSKEDIRSSLKGNDAERVLTVRDINGQLQYRVFVRFGEELYTLIFDADTGEKVDFKKSENLYFNRVGGEMSR